MILVVGAHWRAEYEFWAHAALARRAEVSDEIIDAIAERRQPDEADAADRAVLQFARGLVEQGAVDDAAFMAAAVVLGIEGVVEAVVLVGYYGVVSFTLNAFEVSLPPGVPARWQ